ncbi:hypothetical protein ACJ72_07977, partial [Emergomyces africanus]
GNKIDLRELTENMHISTNPRGFDSIGDDGVLRYFDEAGQVLDYIRLNRDQLLAVLNTYPFTENERKRLTKVWGATNSSQVSWDQIWQSTDLRTPHSADTESDGLKQDPDRDEVQQQEELWVTSHFPPGALKPSWCNRIKCFDHNECELHECFHCMRKRPEQQLGICY